MHREVGNFSKEQSHEASGGVVIILTRQYSEQAEGVVKHQTCVGKTIDGASDKIVYEVGAGCKENNMLDFGGGLRKAWVISVDVVAGDKEGEQTMNDRDNTILEIIDLLLAELGWEFEIVVDEGEEDGPGDNGAGKEGKLLLNSFDSHR